MITYKRLFTLLLSCIALLQHAHAQTSPVQAIFPQGTIVHGNMPYAGDTLKRHLLDIYLPPAAKGPLPLIVWVHGGAWMHNDKYADMGYMKNTVKSFIDSGYAVASIDYRFSTDAPFPAQIQDCNSALEFLYQNAAKYGFDTARIALIGFSAGGHLASLLALSQNNAVTDFYAGGKKPSFKIKCVLDFYGPTDFLVMAGTINTLATDPKNPVALLLGALPFERPDLARRASPVNYIDKADPPFFIVQGELDESVPKTQSQLLSAWLTQSAVPNELIVVPGAPHYGVMFDAADIRRQLFRFLATHLKK